VTCTECHVSLVFTNVGVEVCGLPCGYSQRPIRPELRDVPFGEGLGSFRVLAASHQEPRQPFSLDWRTRHDRVRTNVTRAAVSQFQGLSIECVSCHQQDMLKASLNHQALKFSTTCQTCHNMDTWMNAKFDHAAFTGFALTGMHATLACVDCHVNNNFQMTTTELRGLPLERLHRSTESQPRAGRVLAELRHLPQHRELDVRHLRSQRLYEFSSDGRSRGCRLHSMPRERDIRGDADRLLFLHLKDFQGTTNPNHVQSGFPTACQQCHNTTTWTNATFDHSTTGFPLTGAHTTVQCGQCHINNNTSDQRQHCLLQLPPSRLHRYHEPKPRTGRLPTACQQCHKHHFLGRGDVDHSTTGFPLTGAHTSLQCQQCHVTTLRSGECQHRLLQLPPDRLYQRYKPQPRAGEGCPQPVSNATTRRPGLARRLTTRRRASP